MSHPKRLSRLAAGAALTLLSALPVAAHACDTEPYLGNVCSYSFDWCPRGYVKADGRLLNINAYNALYTLLGTKFGGDGRSTFGIPDLRGRAVVGVGTGTGAVGAFQPVVFAQQLGQQVLTLTTAQVPLPVHTHTASLTTVMGPLVVPATPNQLNVSVKLPVGSSTTGAVPVPPSGSGVNAYLTAMSAKVGFTAVTLVGPYAGGAVPNAPETKLPLTMSIGGTAPTGAVSATVDVVTNVAVSVAEATTNASQPLSTQAPGLGSTMCIAVMGVFPQRP